MSYAATPTGPGTGTAVEARAVRPSALFAVRQGVDVCPAVPELTPLPVEVGEHERRVRDDRAPPTSLRRSPWPSPRAATPIPR